MSFGGFAVDDATMLAFERAVAAVRRETLVVAAAGNHAVARPFYPAAFKRVLAVGAVDQARRRWTRAIYSNYGPWVDACSTGTDVHSTFVRFAATAASPEGFDGGATWSGTSFAAPRVSAAAAALATRDGIDVRLAAHRLLYASSAPVVPELGRIVR
jgi:subtilisin family serine protease